MRQMTLVAFLQAQNCSNFVGSWRHPNALPDFTSPDYYRRIGRTLEAGRFHLGFFDDRLAMPDRYGNDHAHTVEYGIRCVKMDPVISAEPHRLGGRQRTQRVADVPALLSLLAVPRQRALVTTVSQGALAARALTRPSGMASSGLAGRDRRATHGLRSP